MNDLRFSYSCKNNNALQLFWLPTSFNKTPKTFKKKWEKSTIFNRENKNKNKKFLSRLSTPISWKSSYNKQKVSALLVLKSINKISMNLQRPLKKSIRNQIFCNSQLRDRKTCIDSNGWFANIYQWVERRG